MSFSDQLADLQIDANITFAAQLASRHQLHCHHHHIIIIIIIIIIIVIIVIIILICALCVIVANVRVSYQCIRVSLRDSLKSPS